MVVSPLLKALLHIDIPRRFDLYRRLKWRTDIYAVFLACVLCHGILASVMSKIMGKLQTVFVVMNFILILATIIALPIGARYHRNDGHYIFADSENLTTWPSGWAFFLAWLSPIWTIGMRETSFLVRT